MGTSCSARCNIISSLCSEVVAFCDRLCEELLHIDGSIERSILLQLGQGICHIEANYDDNYGV